MRTLSAPVLLLLTAACGPRDIQVLGEGRHDLTQSLRADRVEIMPGAVVYLSPGTVIVATEDLRMAGEIRGRTADEALVLSAGQDLWILGKVIGGTGAASARGQQLVLVAERDVVIRGVARGGDGGGGSPWTNGQSGGGAGGLGGRVTVDAGRDVIVSGVLTGGLGGAGGGADDLSGGRSGTLAGGAGGNGGDITLRPTRRLTVNGAATGGKGGASGTVRVKAVRAEAVVEPGGAGGEVRLERVPSRLEIPGTVRGGDSGEIGVETSFSEGVESAVLTRSASHTPGTCQGIQGDKGRNAGAAEAWARIPGMTRHRLAAVERQGALIPAAVARSEPLQITPDEALAPGGSVARADLEAMMAQPGGVPSFWPMEERGRTIGFQVAQFPDGSPLAQAGLRAGDVITRVNGMSLDSMQGAVTAYEVLKAQHEFRVDIIREGTPQVLQIQLR